MRPTFSSCADNSLEFNYGKLHALNFTCQMNPCSCKKKKSKLMRETPDGYQLLFVFSKGEMCDLRSEMCIMAMDVNHIDSDTL